MSELIVIGFKDQHRASEVLNELLRRAWDWVVDLDHAVVVGRNDEDQFRVHFSVNPTIKGEIAWPQVWGSLLDLIFVFSISNGMINSAKKVSAVSDSESNSGEVIPNASWWMETLCISRDFIRDVGAMIQPGDSAIFMLLQTNNPAAVFKNLRDYGGTLLRATLSEEQDAKLKTILA